MGYRITDPEFPELMEPIPQVKEGMRVKFSRDAFMPRKRAVGAISLGVHVQGAAPFIADRSHMPTMLAGCMKRFCAMPPDPDEMLMRQLDDYSWYFFKTHFVPLPVGTDVSFERYLAECGHPPVRIRQLEECAQTTANLDQSNVYCNGHGKASFFLEPKHCRGINARTDEVKTKIAGVVHAVEEVYKDTKYCLKRETVDGKAARIVDELYEPGAEYHEHDFKAFESLFTRFIMHICEFRFLRYMTQFVVSAALLDLFEAICTGTNLISYRFFTLWLPATRMSGEQQTSLGNSITNLLIMSFLCFCCHTRCRGFVEGDDGLFRLWGPGPTEDMFTRLGFRVKIKRSRDLETTNFCQIYVSVKDRQNVINPANELVTFGWSLSSLRFARPAILMQLLRAKSLSLLYYAPMGPITRSLALYGLRITAGSTPRSDDVNTYSKVIIDQAILHAPRLMVLASKPISDDMRNVVYKNWGISAQLQLEIEAYLDHLTVMQPLDHPSIMSIMDGNWLRSATAYVTNRGPASITIH